jgi:Na+-transporting NADH:ubiquinone oxidoreductase subunit NqrF
VAVICCVIGFIIIWFVLLRGKAKVKVNDKEITINGDDKEELHREVLELKKIIKKLQNAKK